MTAHTGYFGKVSTHGDFVARRLPDLLVRAWDGWLQQCVHESRTQLGGAWLTHYLTSPVWRFAVAPGVLGPDGLAGVLMPSVDRVGRYYPLMLGAVGRAGAPPLLDWFRHQAAWYDAIDDLARESLDPAFRLERFDTMPAPAPTPAAGGAVRVALEAGPHAALAAAPLPGHSLWWTEGSPSIEASLLVCAGLPRPEAFAAMLDGSWAAHDWIRG